MFVPISQILAIVIGLLMYIICANPKLAEVGRILFFVGLLTFFMGGFGISTLGHLR